MNRRERGVWLLVVGLLIACQPSGENRPYLSVGADVGALRTAFNADSGKVRVVMLVAPS